MATRPSSPPGPYPKGADIATLLDWHMRVGTRPESRLIPWTNGELAERCAVSPSTISRWRTGRTRLDIAIVSVSLFGDGARLSARRQDFEEAYFHRVSNPEIVETEFQSAAEQRPAAYRFGVRNDKIDILPEPPEPTDPAIAQDILQELLEKARDLQDRLSRTNSADRALHSINGLLAALGGDFANLREGIILSRVRSIEADRAAYDTEEGRNELFPEAIALLDDTLRTAQDLLACFPKVRRIEAERIALELERHPQDIAAIEREMVVISQAAAASGAASEAAIEAINQNDRAIQTARDAILRTGLIGDKLLVVRNFAGAVITKIGSELGELGAKSWDAFKEEFPKGVGMVARGGPLVLLATAIAGPAGGIAASVAAFKPLSKLYNKVVGRNAGEQTSLGPATVRVTTRRINETPVITRRLRVVNDQVDSHLLVLGARMGVTISRSGQNLIFRGEMKDVEAAEKALVVLAKKPGLIYAEDVEKAIDRAYQINLENSS